MSERSSETGGIGGKIIIRGTKLQMSDEEEPIESEEPERFPENLLLCRSSSSKTDFRGDGFRLVVGDLTHVGEAARFSAA